MTPKSFSTAFGDYFFVHLNHNTEKMVKNRNEG